MGDNNSFDIGSVATQAAQQGTSAILGLALGGINDRRQIKQQQRLQDMQIRGQMQMGDYNYQQQMKMWEATNFQAQKEQMKKAQLSTGLLYGMNGAGGSTTGSQGGSVSGASAPAGGGEAIDMMGMGIQYQLLKAQKENIEADTANKQADTTNKPLQGAEIVARTGNIKADTKLKELDGKIKGETIEEQMTEIRAIADRAVFEVTKARNEVYVQGETLREQIQTVRLAATEAAVRIGVGRADIANKNETTKKITQDITNSIRDLDIREAQQKLNDWAERAKIDVANKGLNIMLIKATIDSILRMGMN